MLYYTKTVRAVLSDLDTTENGLPTSEAIRRLSTYGPNSIKVSGEPLWRKLIAPFASVFMAVLFVATIISFIEGARFDALIILIIIGVSATIYYIQRFSTDRVLKSLSRHDRQLVDVWRDQTLSSVDISELVPGDIIELGEGEKIPADARLIAVQNMRVDEAQLTGESEPVAKGIEQLNSDKEIYEQSNMLFQGSFVVSGKAAAVITATGNQTQFGQLATLSQNTTAISPVQEKIDKLLTQIIGVVAVLAVIALGLSLLRGVDLAESIRFMIVLSVSAVPESLPVAISVILVLGMRRLATKKALVRTMPAIETMGSITTIATDKTGTLTKNILTVQTTWHPTIQNNKFQALIARSINGDGVSLHDPLDKALRAYTKSEVVSKQSPLLTLSFDQVTSMSGNLWHHGRQYDLAIKGAPEHVIARSDMTEGEKETAEIELHRLASLGYRVIAIGLIELRRPIEQFSDLTAKDKLTFAGFVAVADTLRPEAKAAVATALQAGITVRMITGDHFETAYHIGKQLGLLQNRSQVFDSRKLHTMTDQEVEEIIDSIRVFSRVIPEHKYRILTLLNKKGITAMTGDGVNDVPALTKAHVGIAMGSGASIARDAGDIILLNDNFTTIVTAVAEGRIIFSNIRRMLYYLLATNAGEVLTLLGALVVGLPVPLAPIQILWVNLVTDTAMVIPLGLEPGSKDVMKQRPKHPKAPILGKFMISRIVLLALTMAAVILGIYAYFSSRYGHEYAETIAFSSLVVIQWASAFVARSDNQPVWSRLKVVNRPFYIGLAVAIILQLLVIFGPLGSALQITSVAIGDLVITSVIAFVIPIVVIELHKYIGRRFYGRGFHSKASHDSVRHGILSDVSSPK